MTSLLADLNAVHFDVGDPFADAPPGNPFDGLHAEDLPEERPWLTFADWILAVAGVVASKGTPGATWLGRELRQLGELALQLDAATPAELDARRAAEWAREDNRLRDEGYSAGLDAISNNHPLY